MRIAIVGWWGRGNMGDDLILRNMVRWLAPHRCTAVTDHPFPYPDGMDEVTYAVFDETAHEYDLVLFGSGGVLNDRYVRGVLPPERVARISCPLWAFAVGVPTEQWLEGIEYFLDRCDLLSTRDDRARRMVLSRHPKLHVEVVPDPGYLTEPAGVDRVPSLVGLTIRTLARSWLLGLPEEALTAVADAFVLAREGLAQRNIPTVVFAHEPRDLDLYASLGVHDAVLLDAMNAAPEIARVGALVTMRLHGGIVAFTQGTPVRVIDYQAKCAALDDAAAGVRIDPQRPEILRGVLSALEEGPGKNAELVARMRSELAAFRAARL